MPYDKLIKQGRIKAYQAGQDEIKQLLEISLRDLEAAKSNLTLSPDWSYTMAYNAVLQSARALMLSAGYRPRGSEQHAAVVEFARERLGNTFISQVNLFDQMRRKRHRVIYDVSGLINTAEAEQAIAFAHEFVDQLRHIITGQLSMNL